MKLRISIMLIILGLAVGCGAETPSRPTNVSSPSVVETPTPPGYIGDTHMGEPTPLPVVDKIGDCRIQPGTQCPGADLTGADLGATTTAGGHTSRWPADLTNANLSGADLSGANLSRVKLEGADLSNTNLTGVGFQDALLFEADLSGADLTDAILTFADIDGINLTGAILCNTTMSNGDIRNDGCSGKGLEPTPDPYPDKDPSEPTPTPLVAGTATPLPTPTGPPISASEAKDFAGEMKTVCGEVVSTFASQNIVLNIDKPFPRQIFTVVITRASFEAIFGRGPFEEPPEQQYLDNQICVSGLIVLSLSTGVPQIEVTEPDQISVE